MSSLSTKVPTVQHVFYYGWLSALSTGLGSLPLLMWSNPSSTWLGVSNAVAAGMMLSASFSLVDEGTKLEQDGTILYGYAVRTPPSLCVHFPRAPAGAPLPYRARGPRGISLERSGGCGEVDGCLHHRI